METYSEQVDTIQILLGIFHVFMWYFLLILYMGQIRGVFGTYEPVTYRIGCTLWGIFFIISGAVLIKVAQHPSPSLVTLALILNITCIITVIIAVILTIVELSSFHSVSYRNYGQAKLGREVSRVLLFSYLLELAIAFTYSIFGCIDLWKYAKISTEDEKGNKDIGGKAKVLTRPYMIWLPLLIPSSTTPSSFSTFRAQRRRKVRDGTATGSASTVKHNLFPLRVPRYKDNMMLTPPGKGNISASPLLHIRPGSLPTQLNCGAPTEPQVFHCAEDVRVGLLALSLQHSSLQLQRWTA
ncbi:PREDICTED: membrane-spanning 4-domains subfamily A member 13 [Myotis brandtii]|uniref:membrane-spanning 4-domains subfamily A member 13 n=1 Tax=Myotis brandtii TaxID=109478 RepID=UPI0003BB97BD|nr:PREDICTED: membrane-spanning 4-domains subfamily A member 13 [Myotis brandtii]